MQERRTVRRIRVLKSAEIVYGEQVTSLLCTLLDLSANGARLSFASTQQVPEHFHLSFDNGLVRRECRVVWRNDYQVGVAFAAAQAARVARSPPPRLSAKAPVDIFSRVLGRWRTALAAIVAVRGPTLARA
jgi:hypothetical protein